MHTHTQTHTQTRIYLKNHFSASMSNQLRVSGINEKNIYDVYV